eukprot:8808777-Pyramimonas_sp.AAC.1
MQEEAMAATEVAVDGIQEEATEELKEEVHEAKGLRPTASDHALNAAVRGTSPLAAPEGPTRLPPAQGGSRGRRGSSRRTTSGTRADCAGSFQHSGARGGCRGEARGRGGVE